MLLDFSCKSFHGLSQTNICDWQWIFYKYWNPNQTRNIRCLYIMTWIFLIRRWSSSKHTTWGSKTIGCHYSSNNWIQQKEYYWYTKDCSTGWNKQFVVDISCVPKYLIIPRYEHNWENQRIYSSEYKRRAQNRSWVFRNCNKHYDDDSETHCSSTYRFEVYDAGLGLWIK